MNNKSDSIKELASALSKAQGEMAFAPMDSVNPFLKNKYADLVSIIKTAKPVLVKNGLSVSQLVTGDGSTVGVTSTLMHASGEWIESTVCLPLPEEKGKSQAQVAGSVITYLRRYSLASILGMASDEDTDGNDHTTVHKPEPVQQKAAENIPSKNIEPSSNHTNGTIRPLSPETLRDFLKKKADDYGTKSTVTTQQRGLAAGMLELCFAGEVDADAKRHLVTKYLTGSASTNEVSAGMIKALLDWLKPVKDSGGAYQVDKMACKEMSSVYTAAQHADGQQDLFSANTGATNA